MRAVDTNIVIRLIARDHPEQFAVAERIVAERRILILPTVVLECEWVLRSRYGFTRTLIAESLATLFGQTGVSVLFADAVAAALVRYAEAGDFADHLHVALAAEAGATAFVTFDRDISVASDRAILIETL